MMDFALGFLGGMVIGIVVSFCVIYRWMHARSREEMQGLMNGPPDSPAVEMDE